MSHYVIHYSEIGLKGGNRSQFERRLAEHIAISVGTGLGAIRRQFGRMVLALETARPASAVPVEEALARIPGISYFARATLTPLDLVAIRDEAVRQARGAGARSFRIDTRRSNKSFPLTSVEVNREIGALVALETGMKVDLRQPDLTVWIELARREGLVYTRRHRGIGGLPAGMSGTVVGLLSGGIDSPVAAFHLIRRGARVVLVHFHNYSRHEAAVRDKIVELARVLATYQLDARLYIVPFAELQSCLVAAIPPGLRMVAYRRVMLRIAERVAEREGALALVTGDSLGQVASQTLENLHAIYAATALPVLTPLVGLDKDDIVASARRIGTFDISVRPYEDCCSFLVARHPATRVGAEAIARRERTLPLEELSQSALERAEILELGARAGSGAAVSAGAAALEGSA